MLTRYLETRQGIALSPRPRPRPGGPRAGPAAAPRLAGLSPQPRPSRSPDGAARELKGWGGEAPRHSDKNAPSSQQENNVPVLEKVQGWKHF